MNSWLTRGLAAALLGCLLASSGCVYQMDIQQGNFLEGRTVDQLQVGMTRTQVRYLLGTPMIPTAFDKDRWDYLYYLKRGHARKIERRHLIVFFKNEKVSRFVRDHVPESAPGAPNPNSPPINKFPRI